MSPIVLNIGIAGIIKWRSKVLIGIYDASQFIKPARVQLVPGAEIPCPGAGLGFTQLCEHN